MQFRLPERLAAALALAACAAVPAARAQVVAPPPWPAADAPASAAADPTHALLLGGVRLALDTTTIAGLRDALGAGRPVRHGSGTEALDWLCFTLPEAAPPQRLWMTSSELAGGRIDGVTAVELAPGTPAAEACPALPPRLRPVRFEDGLWLGTAAADLRKSLGLPARPGRSFATLYHGQSGDLDVVGSIALELRNGRVSSLHVAHSTGH
jgi:hypothetical protein